MSCHLYYSIEISTYENLDFVGILTSNLKYKLGLERWIFTYSCRRPVYKSIEVSKLMSKYRFQNFRTLIELDHFHLCVSAVFLVHSETACNIFSLVTMKYFGLGCQIFCRVSFVKEKYPRQLASYYVYHNNIINYIGFFHIISFLFMRVSVDTYV